MLPVHSLVRLAMVAVASGGCGGGGGRRVPELLTEWLTRRPRVPENMDICTCNGTVCLGPFVVLAAL